MSDDSHTQIIAAAPDWYTVCVDPAGQLFVDEVIIAWFVEAHAGYDHPYTRTKAITYTGVPEHCVAVQSPDGRILEGREHRMANLAQAQRAYNGGKWDGLKERA